MKFTGGAAVILCKERPKNRVLLFPDRKLGNLLSGTDEEGK